MKILFCGTPKFAVRILQELLQSRHEIVGVLTQPPRPKGRGGKSSPSPVGEAAALAGVPVWTESPSKPETLAWIRSLNPDAAVVAAYGRIFRKEFLDLPSGGVLNIHPSLLPRWRGASPVHAALLAGDRLTGVCVMKLVEELDAGPVFAREETVVGPEEDRADLEERLAAAGSRLLLSVLGNPAGFPPLLQAAEGVSYCPKLGTGDERLRWNEAPSASLNRIRAFAPDPCAHFMLPTGKGLPGTESCKVLKAEACEGRGRPGEVLGPGPGGSLIVACGENGAIAIRRLRPSGKKDQDGISLLNGRRVSPGDILN